MIYIQKHKKIIISITISFLWICLVGSFTGIFFETNDDRLFSEIFSGAMTGTPEFRSYYIHPFLGLFITFFYRITTALPWYGLLLILLQWICHAAFTFCILNHFETTQKKLSAISFIIIYYAICFTFIAHIQFTSTAALLAITGYICLLFAFSYSYVPESTPNSYTTLFFILQILSYCLRSDSMLMIQPYGIAMFFAIVLCKWLKTHKADFPKLFFKILFGIVILILLGKVTHLLFHSGEGWKEYEKVNQGVTEITDYSHIPEYAEVKDILEKYDVSEKQYLAFFQYAMIEPNLSGDCLLEIAEYAKNMQPATAFSEVLAQARETFSNPEYYGIGKLILLLWMITAIYILFSRKFLLLLPMVSLIGSRTVIWSYLIYRGRTPFRVIYPLWVMEALLLILILYTAFDVKDSVKKSTHFEQISNFKWLVTIILFSGSLFILFKQYSTIAPQNKSDKIYNMGYCDLINYCDEHPENHYFLDASILLYYRGSAFTSEPYHPRNSLITGCWYSGAPVLYEHIAEYAPDNIDIHLIVSPDLAHQKDAVIAYFEEWRGATATFEEAFTVSNGGTYEVYRF